MADEQGAFDEAKTVQQRLYAERDQLQAERARMIADLEEQTRLTEQAQAENERLKADVEQQAQNWTLLFSDYEQEQAWRNRLEEALRRFGIHGGACLDETACDCGLEAALDQRRKE